MDVVDFIHVELWTASPDSNTVKHQIRKKNTTSHIKNILSIGDNVLSKVESLMFLITFKYVIVPVARIFILTSLRHDLTSSPTNVAILR